MKQARSHLLSRLLTLALITLGAPVVMAQGTTSSTTAGETVVTRLVAEFADWAGSSENATALVRGLRRGSTIVLSDTGGIFTPPSSATFDPPTKPLGYGEVRIALALAEARLAQQGITDPTPLQLQTALLGVTPAPGTTARRTGILQMRAAGMGWGEIASSMGVTLGSVMSSKSSAAADKAASGKSAAPGLAKKDGDNRRNDGAGNANRGSSAGGSSGSSGGGKGGGSGNSGGSGGGGGGRGSGK